jgi:hypothetical protein
MTDAGRGHGDPPEFRMRVRGDPLKPGEIYESPTLPLPPPRDQAELDELLHAIASTPSGDRQLVIDTVDGFTDRERVASLLHDSLLTLPVRDDGRHLMILSVIGQLSHETSLDPLERFVWLANDEVHEGGGSADLPFADGGAACHFRPDWALQARAAEMFVWVGRGALSSGVIRILGSHPGSPVRVATIDALAFAADDDVAVLERLTEQVQPDDRWAVGIPRRTSDGDPEAFDARVMERMAAIGEAAVPADPEEAERGDRDVH